MEKGVEWKVHLGHVIVATEAYVLDQISYLL